MKAAQEKFFASCQASQEQGELDRGRSPSKTPEDSCLSQREQCSQIPSVVMCALCRDSCSYSTISFLTFVQRSKLLEIAAKGVPSWQKRDQSKCVEALNFNEGTDTDLSVGDSDVHESQIRVELLNLIQMALNGDVDREGPIEVEALLAFLGDEGFTESVDGSQSSVETRMAETTSSDSGSDDSEEEEGIMVRNDPPNTFLDCSGLALAKGGAAAEFEDETAKIRQHFLITVLLEYANLLSKNRKDQQQPESENSASLQKHSFSRLSQRNAAGESPHHHVGSNDLLGTHVSSCGHAVHQECLDRYRSSLLQRYQSRTLFEGLQIVDPNQREFLCPVCRRLANSVLPYITEATVPGDAGEEQAVSFANSLLSPSTSSSSLASLVSHAMNLLRNAEELVWKPGFRKAFSKPLSRTLRSTFDSLFWTLFGLQFPGRENNSRHSSNRISHSLLLWDALRYTVMSLELASRTQRDGQPEHTLKVLLKLGDEGSILPVLLRSAKAIQNQNRQSLLLRARGMQLLVGSICFGVSKDSLAEPLMPGSVSKLLHLIDNGKEAADIHFWRRTADPVLVHDPFASLFWIVFCFPLSFPSSIESFVSVVHLLYLVCILQIMASLGSQILSNLSELQLTSSAGTMLQTILTNLNNIRLFQPFYSQNSEVLSGQLLSTIRRFTLPYLRRCALLGKLLCDIDFTDIKDLDEMEYLEQKFALPSLQSIFESEGNQEIALRWCDHVCKDAGPRKILPVPRPTLAAPFKLMDLPPLYQTLLQFYIRESCPVCLSVPEQPALCLLCGTLCCGLGRRSCSCSINRQSECFRHAVTCNGGVGVFLMIKKTNILLQRSARQAYWPSPYLDDFGEEDIDMHRGKPLYLNAERYAALTKMVVSHGLDHSSLVLSHTTWETVIWG
ncbi:hypothetical protein L7F22_049716 [Adiantum nelumboides]|nr:hypothetical protein [Adiantum nelumboides]